MRKEINATLTTNKNNFYKLNYINPLGFQNNSKNENILTINLINKSEKNIPIINKRKVL
jgi:hypothetical protein